MTPSVHEYHLRGCLLVSVTVIALLLGVTGTVGYAVWKTDEAHVAPTGYGGDPERGKNLILIYGCTSCHAIGGAAPRGRVGPPLDGMASRSYIAGRFANDEIRMVQWLEHPQNLEPGTAMPELNVGERDARDLAAYLATLR